MRILEGFSVDDQLYKKTLLTSRLLSVEMIQISCNA